MSNLAREYLKNSELDFLGPFANLWMGFNSWYQDLHPAHGDQKGCLLMASTFAPIIEAQLHSLNDIDQFVSQEVDSLSTCRCNGYTYSHDVSGFKFRLQCQNQSPTTEFLQRASKSPLLKRYTAGVKFFEPIGKPDKLFRHLYRTYRKWEASAEGIVYSADVARITSNLGAIGVEHYGHMLFHNFSSSSGTGLYTIDDVFGRGRGALLASIGTMGRRGIVAEFGENSRETCAWDLRNRAQDITSLYLFVLYKFRCEYFHGNIRPGNRANQNLAQAAFFSLRGLMEATLA